jgi:U3 small nucleolar RNA-associated protein 10
VFGHLITRALLCRLSGANQLEAAHQVLEMMPIDGKIGTGNTVVDNLDFANVRIDGHRRGSISSSCTSLQPEYATELENNIVLKPSNRLTLYSLQMSMLAVIAQLPRPSGVVINWLSNQSLVSPFECRGLVSFVYFLRQEAVHGIAETFMETMRIVYGLAQSLGAHSMSMLSILFNNLEADSLAFLAGIWTGSSDQELCLVSLRHASAFLQAHCSADQPLDFQTVLPSLIVAVQTLDRPGREAALECIAQLVIPTDKRFSAVYCLDTIYGSGSCGYFSSDSSF